MNETRGSKLNKELPRSTILAINIYLHGLGKMHIKKVFLSGRTTKKGGGLKTPVPLRRKTLFYDLQKKKKMQVMFSAGQYRSTEKGFEKN